MDENILISLKQSNRYHESRKVKIPEANADIL